MPGVSCGMQDLVLWLGIKPGAPALGAWSLSHWTTREVPGIFVELDIKRQKYRKYERKIETQYIDQGIPTEKGESTQKK